MYYIAAYFDVQPERRQEFVDAALEDGRNSIANEPGTKRFELIEDKTNPDRLYLNEAHDDEDAFNAHANGRYRLPSEL
jgi:autoinducer 2-degrading protein